jgi:hypothetical protein
MTPTHGAARRVTTSAERCVSIDTKQLDLFGATAVIPIFRKTTLLALALNAILISVNLAFNLAARLKKWSRLANNPCSDRKCGKSAAWS